MKMKQGAFCALCLTLAGCLVNPSESAFNGKTGRAGTLQANLRIVHDEFQKVTFYTPTDSLQTAHARLFPYLAVPDNGTPFIRVKVRRNFGGYTAPLFLKSAHVKIRDDVFSVHSDPKDQSFIWSIGGSNQESIDVSAKQFPDLVARLVNSTKGEKVKVRLDGSNGVEDCQMPERDRAFFKQIHDLAESLQE